MTQSKVTEFINFLRESGVENALYKAVQCTAEGTKRPTRTMFGFLSMLRCEPKDFMSESLVSLARAGAVIDDELRHRFMMVDHDWRNKLQVSQMTDSEVEGERNG